MAPDLAGKMLMIPLGCFEQKGRRGRGSRAWLSNFIMMQIVEEHASPPRIGIQRPDPRVQTQIARLGGLQSQNPVL